MAASTFTSAGVNNLWSNAANWSAGVPTDLGGAVTIAANQTCVFDVDQSAWTNGITSLTLAANARLEASTTAGTYYLKMAGNITASAAGAVIAAGSSGTAYPSTCKFTIYLNGNYQINCHASNYLTLLLYCYQPANTYALLSGAESAGATVLEVDRDLSACPEWTRAGAIIRVDNINKAAQSEALTIQSVAAGAITTTGGLANSKLQGSYVILATRNIAITSSATAISNGMIRYGSGHVINAAIRPGSTSTDGIRDAVSCTIDEGSVFSGSGSAIYIGSGHTVTSVIFSGNTSGINGGTGHTVTSATFSGNTSAINSGTGHTVTSVIFSGNTSGINGGTGHTVTSVIFSGNASGISGGIGHTVTSATFSGNASAINSGTGHTVTSVIFSGNAYGINGGSGHTVTSATFSGNNAGTYLSSGLTFITSSFTDNSSGIYYGSGIRLYTCSFATNTYDKRAVSDFIAYNTTFGSSTEFYEYTSIARTLPAFAESINHDNSANAYRAWTRGGIVSSDTGTVYTGRTRSYAHACESATAYCFRNYTVTVDAGGGLVVQTYVRKSATMTYLPRIWILLPGVEPFVSGTPTAEAIMTDSVDTWETLTLVYANSGTAPVTVTVRTVAMNASGTVYFDPIITPLAPATYDVYNTLLANQALILADTGELQTDWANGGRLDTILDARASQTTADAILADTDTDGVAISAATGNQIADQVLRRGFAAASASANGDAKSFRSLLGAVAKLVNRIGVSSSTLTVYEADDTTAIGMQTVTASGSTAPITELNTN